MAFLDKFTITRQLIVSSNTNLYQIVATFYQKNLEEAVSDEVVKGVKELASKVFTDDPEIRQIIKTAVEEAIKALPLEVLVNAVRQTVSEEIQKYINKEEKPTVEKQ